MIKTLYVVSAIMLICAGIVTALCGAQWLWGTSYEVHVPELSALRQPQAGGRPGDGIDREATPPLIRQATAFALYLKPPQPAVPEPPPGSQAVARPIPRPPAVMPQFRLLSTSYHRSCPEKSLALVAEPGKGGYWIAQGDRVGHLVVERIKDGRIVWRDGSRLQETAVAIKDTPSLAQVKSRMPVAVRSGGSEVRPVSASLSDARGMGTSGAQPVADEGLD